MNSLFFMTSFHQEPYGKATDLIVHTTKLSNGIINYIADTNTLILLHGKLEDNSIWKVGENSICRVVDNYRQWI